MFILLLDDEAALEDAKLTILEQAQFQIFFIPSQTCGTEQGRSASFALENFQVIY